MEPEEPIVMRIQDLPTVELAPGATVISVPTDAGMPPKKLVVIMAEFNEGVTRRLANGAAQAAKELGIVRVEIWPVPGALEIPVLLGAMVTGNEWTGTKSPLIVTAACIIQGDTDHYHHVCTQSITGVQNLAVQYSLPLGNAILTVRNPEQAIERCQDGPSNKGYEAAMAASRLHRLFRKAAG